VATPFLRPFTCVQLIYFTDQKFFYVISVNTDKTFFFDANVVPELTTTQAELAFACIHINYFVEITNPATLAFDKIAWENK
jgi:hypothetical protein